MNPKDWIDLAKERNIRLTSMFEMLEQGVYPSVSSALDRVWDGTDAQYVSMTAVHAWAPLRVEVYRATPVATE